MRCFESPHAGIFPSHGHPPWNRHANPSSSPAAPKSSRLCRMELVPQLHGDTRLRWQYADIGPLYRYGDGHDDVHSLVILDDECVRGTLGINHTDGPPVGSGKVLQSLQVVNFPLGLHVDRATNVPLE